MTYVYSTHNHKPHTVETPGARAMAEHPEIPKNDDEVQLDEKCGNGFEMGLPEGASEVRYYDSKRSNSATVSSFVIVDKDGKRVPPCVTCAMAQDPETVCTDREFAGTVIAPVMLVSIDNKISQPVFMVFPPHPDMTFIVTMVGLGVGMDVSEFHRIVERHGMPLFLHRDDIHERAENQLKRGIDDRDEQGGKKHHKSIQSSLLSTFSRKE